MKQSNKPSDGVTVTLNGQFYVSIYWEPLSCSTSLSLSRTSTTQTLTRLVLLLSSLYLDESAITAFLRVLGDIHGGDASTCTSTTVELDASWRPSRSYCPLRLYEGFRREWPGHQVEKPVGDSKASDLLLPEATTCRMLPADQDPPAARHRVRRVASYGFMLPVTLRGAL